jgi:hypothetical protein
MCSAAVAVFHGLMSSSIQWYHCCSCIFGTNHNIYIVSSVAVAVFINLVSKINIYYWCSCSFHLFSRAAWTDSIVAVAVLVAYSIQIISIIYVLCK